MKMKSLGEILNMQKHKDIIDMASSRHNLRFIDAKCMYFEFLSMMQSSVLAKCDT